MSKQAVNKNNNLVRGAVYVGAGGLAAFGIYKLLNKFIKPKQTDVVVEEVKQPTYSTKSGSKSTKTTSLPAPNKPSPVPLSTAIYFYAKEKIWLYKTVTDGYLSITPGHKLVEITKGMFAGKFTGKKIGNYVGMSTKIASGDTLYFWADETKMSSKNVFDASNNKTATIINKIVTEYNRR
jgi:hypothetical protein